MLFYNDFCRIDRVLFASSLRRDAVAKCAALRMLGESGGFGGTLRNGTSAIAVVRARISEGLRPRQLSKRRVHQNGALLRPTAVHTARRYPKPRHKVSRRFLRNKWCPETELNRRHADFQSAALPTELSGHVGPKAGPFGCGGLKRGRGGCPEGLAKKSLCPPDLLWADRHQVGGWGIVIFSRLGRDGVTAGQPATQIDICAAA